MRTVGVFCLFFGDFFFPFKPVSQIKLDRIHHWQETLEGAVCWVEQRPRASRILLPSLPLALTQGLAGGESPPRRTSWRDCGIPGGTAPLFKLASARHVILGRPKLMGSVCWLSQVLVFIPSKPHQESEIKGPGCYKKLRWICKLSFRYASGLRMRVLVELEQCCLH